MRKMEGELTVIPLSSLLVKALGIVLMSVIVGSIISLCLGYLAALSEYQGPIFGLDALPLYIMIIVICGLVITLIFYLTRFTEP